MDQGKVDCRFINSPGSGTEQFPNMALADRTHICRLHAKIQRHGDWDGVRRFKFLVSKKITNDIHSMVTRQKTDPVFTTKLQFHVLPNRTVWQNG